MTASGGCAGKVPAERLDRLLKSAGEVLTELPPGPIKQRRDLLDSVVLGFDPPLASSVVSADLLYRMCEADDLFGEIAIAHAFSDVYASWAVPLFTTLVLIVPLADVDTDRPDAILRTAAETAVRAGAAVAGGHTAAGDTAALAVCVVGAPLVDSKVGTPVPGDLVLLSKPLGTGLAISAVQLGACAEADIAQELTAMRRTNEESLRLLLGAEESRPGSVRALTDVSGFGLLIALHASCRTHDVIVRADDVPRFGSTERWIQVQAWSELLDQNLLRSDEFTDYDGSTGFPISVILNDPQTSGGLLALVDPDVVEDNGLLSAFVNIGEVAAARRLDPRISVR